MSPVTVGRVAVAVFKESVRDRVPLSMVFFAAVLIAASLLLSQLSAGQDVKIIKDLGLATMNVIGLLISVFVGTGLVAKEIERRSIYAVLSKPVTRSTYLLGKYCGLLLTLASNLAAMAVALYLVLAYFAVMTPLPPDSSRPPHVDPWLLLPVGLLFVQLMVTTAAGLFFSTFSGPLLTVLFTLAFWVAGHFGGDLRDYGRVVDSPLAAGAARTLYYLLPNFGGLDVKNDVVHGAVLSAPAIAAAVAAAITYVIALLGAAAAIFERRDLK